MTESDLIIICPCCGEHKPITEFHRKRKSPMGRQKNCKTCVSKSMKVRYKLITGGKAEGIYR